MEARSVIGKTGEPREALPSVIDPPQPILQYLSPQTKPPENGVGRWTARFVIAVAVVNVLAITPAICFGGTATFLLVIAALPINLVFILASFMMIPTVQHGAGEASIAPFVVVAILAPISASCIDIWCILQSLK